MLEELNDVFYEAPELGICLEKLRNIIGHQHQGSKQMCVYFHLGEHCMLLLYSSPLNWSVHCSLLPLLLNESLYVAYKLSTRGDVFHAHKFWWAPSKLPILTFLFPVFRPHCKTASKHCDIQLNGSLVEGRLWTPGGIRVGKPIAITRQINSCCVSLCFFLSAITFHLHYQNLTNLSFNHRALLWKLILCFSSIPMVSWLLFWFKERREFVDPTIRGCTGIDADIQSGMIATQGSTIALTLFCIFY